MFYQTSIKKCLLLGLALAAYVTVFAQSNLDKVVPVNVTRQRLDQVLEILSNRGNFYFSYNSNIVKRDSLVTLAAANRSVRQILTTLFPSDYEFRESGNYIIIRKAPVKLTIVTNKAVTVDNQYIVSGYVLDDHTGMQIPDASIYEKRLLVSTMTDSKGYFKLKFKNKVQTAALTVSKEFYEDTTVLIEPRYNQQITVTLLPEGAPDITIVKPEDYFVPDSLRVRVTSPSGTTEYTYVRQDSARVEQTRAGAFLVSSRQRIQSINLKKFFTDRPFQISLTPGLSTHGKLSGQVINNFSFNILGGYSGGVNGLEIGGLFNIDKKDVRFVQVAGLFNIVGGQVQGLQVGGITNNVLNNTYGLQIGGVSNYVKGDLDGLQIGGVYNHAAGFVKGMQIGGVGNFAKEKVSGMQVAGVGNVANRDMSGVQIGGVFNYAKRMKGVQIGLINIADTSSGYSIGLINIILKGYHKFALSSNEVTNINAAFKTGSHRLYSILQAGMNISEWNADALSKEQAYSFGYGLGSELSLARWLSINPEVSANYLYLGEWKDFNFLGKAALNLNLRLGKYFSIFGGLVFNVYYTEQTSGVPGYRFPMPPSGYNKYLVGKEWPGWIGWNAGIHIF
ncbi:LA_2272 family surface repeat-containing protein [Pseudocnuella soli]|uniref:LA_2272 family surface repeat-containing protein n=1 Tax=Pseudocnuella soli TaxID=2502779 RepID=UPI00104C2A29|nr:carboxypeptidase-like regulatory domain-containing protein [Pseudocnuella soli]